MGARGQEMSRRQQQALQAAHWRRKRKQDPTEQARTVKKEER